MKKLRILTGRHVGASIELDSGCSLVGAGADCDISISDWSFAPLRLLVEGERVSVEWNVDAAARGSAAAGRTPQHGTMQQRLLADFEPREFDGTIICVGPVEGPWPSDVALLDVVFRPTPQRVARWAGNRIATRRVALWSGAVASLAVVGLAATMLSANASRPAAPQPTIVEISVGLQQALDAVAPRRLQVTVEDQALVIGGLLDAPEHAAAVRNAIKAGRGRFVALARFSVAADVAEAIRNAVGLPNATVRHVADGVFSYVAEAADQRSTRSAIDRIGADLAPAVKRIDATLEQQKARVDLHALSSLETESVSVRHTRDGVKHMVIRPTPFSITARDVLDLNGSSGLLPVNDSLQSSYKD